MKFKDVKPGGLFRTDIKIADNVVVNCYYEKIDLKKSKLCIVEITSNGVIMISQKTNAIMSEYHPDMPVITVISR